MSNTGSNPPEQRIPLWLLAELTYACPLQCPYCSNPLNYPQQRQEELSTEQWVEVMRQARELGAVQLGFSGGEPLVRQDLEELVAEARQFGFYTNLITSSVGMDAARVARLKTAGLDHIQVSFQGSDAQSSLLMAGTDAFEHKLAMAREIKRQGYPMVLNFVLHRQNIDQVGELLQLAEQLEADFVELANTQYYGWALHNREQLLPTREQLQRAEAVTNEFRAAQTRPMQIFFVVPDYYEDRPKACSGGWGSTFITVTPDGTVLPCQSARVIPGLEFPKVPEAELGWIWRESPLFNAFRGTDWMQEPCRSCPEQHQDFGGCRCQAYMLTGDAYATDPVCSLSPRHEIVLDAVARANALQRDDSVQPLVFRTPRNAKKIRQG